MAFVTNRSEVMDKESQGRVQELEIVILTHENSVKTKITFLLGNLNFDFPTWDVFYGQNFFPT